MYMDCFRDSSKHSFKNVSKDDYIREPFVDFSSILPDRLYGSFFPRFVQKLIWTLKQTFLYHLLLQNLFELLRLRIPSEVSLDFLCVSTRDSIEKFFKDSFRNTSGGVLKNLSKIATEIPPGFSLKIYLTTLEKFRQEYFHSYLSGILHLLLILRYCFRSFSKDSI